MQASTHPRTHASNEPRALQNARSDAIRPGLQFKEPCKCACPELSTRLGGSDFRKANADRQRRCWEWRHRAEHACELSQMTLRPKWPLFGRRAPGGTVGKAAYQQGPTQEDSARSRSTC
eukprot:1358778-Pleurochrysis_carterae.AAC.2